MTLTLVIPTASHHACVDTWLRTEQRTFKEALIPLLCGAGIIDGPVFNRAWQVMGTGNIQMGALEVTRTGWVVLFLRGQRNRVTAEHRSYLMSHMQRISAPPPPHGVPPTIQVACEPMTAVTIEAGGPTWRNARREEVWGTLCEKTAYTFADWIGEKTGTRPFVAPARYFEVRPDPLGRGVAVNVDGRISHVRIFTPQHRATADALSRPSTTVAAAPAAKPATPTHAGPGATGAGGGAAPGTESPLQTIRRFGASARAATNP
eukprot:gene36318-50152_t